MLESNLNDGDHEMTDRGLLEERKRWQDSQGPGQLEKWQVWYW